MAGEAELKEIYLGCLRERGEISPPASSQEGKKSETETREEKRREEKLNVLSEIESDCLMLGQMRVDKRKRIVRREEKKSLVLTPGQWSFVVQLEALTTERREELHRYSIGLKRHMGRESIP